jgi:hypothetical protein
MRDRVLFEKIDKIATGVMLAASAVGVALWVKLAVLADKQNRHER